jgi:hypothetical protein
MTTGEPKMTEMSKPAEILYRAFFDELSLRSSSNGRLPITPCY